MEPIKALIVEDVARMAERMKDLVEAAGASVVATSATEDEALEICDRFARRLRGRRPAARTRAPGSA
jgi:CheY-like chemotaxis protein